MVLVKQKFVVLASSSLLLCSYWDMQQVHSPDMLYVILTTMTGVLSGIFIDLGAGSNVDLCIITKGKVDYKRNVELLMGKTYTRQNPVKYAPGTSGEPVIGVASCQPLKC